MRIVQFSDTHISHLGGQWVFAAINSELCSSGLPEEDEQWAWLEEIAARAASCSVMLFLHKPLVIDDGPRDGTTVSAASRDRILSTFSRADLRVVASGHLHRYRCTAAGGPMAVRAPRSRSRWKPWATVPRPPAWD